jgi:hypothetical protein
MGRPQIVNEGEEAPRHQSTVDEKTVQFDKFMGEVTLTMEAMEDGLIEMKAREVEDVARAMSERLNAEAYDVLNANNQTQLNDGVTDIGDGNDTLSFSDIVEGMKALREDSYTPDLLIVDIDGYTDLLTDSNFNRATESGDDVARSGEVGQVAGMPVVIDTTQDISGGHGAFAVDTTRYGYELTRTPMSTREYEEPERQADVIQAFTRKAWTVIFDDAAAVING